MVSLTDPYGSMDDSLKSAGPVDKKHWLSAFSYLEIMSNEFNPWVRKGKKLYTDSVEWHRRFSSKNSGIRTIYIYELNKRFALEFSERY